MDYLILVNKDNKIPDNYEVSLVETINVYGDICLVEKEAFKSYKELEKELADEGIIIKIIDAYRSIESQQEVLDMFMDTYGKDYCDKYVAKPGYSEHHTGLAIDIVIIKDNKPIIDNYELFKEEEIFKIIHSKLSKYGFILRYPKDKEGITGYGYEPWHFRFVGNKDVAKYIKNNKLCLEEYIEKSK